MYAVAHVFFSIILTHCVMNYFIVSNHVDADFHNRMLNRSCSFSSASSGKKIHRLLSNITSKLVQINKLLFHCSSACAQRPFFCKNWLYRYFHFFFFFLSLRDCCRERSKFAKWGTCHSKTDLDFIVSRFVLSHCTQIVSIYPASRGFLSGNFL